jgi:hypothetical protein
MTRTTSRPRMAAIYAPGMVCACQGPGVTLRKGWVREYRNKIKTKE